MKNILGNIRGDLTIKEDTELRAVMIGNITLEQEVSLEVLGTLHGNITIRPGASCLIYGTVNGDIYNNDGSVTVRGTVTGRIHPVKS